MINRLLIFAAVTLGAVALGVSPTAAAGSFASVDVAHAQVATDPDAGLDDTTAGGLDQTGLGESTDETDTPAAADPAAGAPADPAPAPDPDAGLDDTAAGGLDQTDLGGSVDQTDTPAAANPGTDPAPAPAPAPVDPEAGLDDTPVGGLDQTDLGEPIDETDTPATDNPAPAPAPGPAPAPVAPAPTNAAPPAATAPRKSKKVKWVRIKVRVGDTVRKIAKRRGLTADVTAIVKRNKKVKGKRTIRSRGTTLRHRRGAKKATRKKDRIRLWVPAS